MFCVRMRRVRRTRMPSRCLLRSGGCTAIGGGGGGDERVYVYHMCIFQHVYRV